MNESELLSFALWSAVTGVAMLVTGFSYYAYSRKKNAYV